MEFHKLVIKLGSKMWAPCLLLVFSTWPSV